MLNFISRKLQKRKQEKFEKESQRQQKLEEKRERRLRLEEEERKKEEESNKILEIEMDKYLKTTNPAIILHPRMKENIYAILDARARTSGKDADIMAASEEEVNALMNYYNEDLNVFIKLLENKGYKLEGREGNFVTMLESKTRELNYNICKKKIGEDIHTDLKKTFFHYIDVFGDDCRGISQIDFISEYLYRNNLTDKKLTVQQISDKLTEMKKLYDLDFKVRKMENRLNNSSNNNVQITIQKIDTLNGIEFENFLVDLFTNLGYKVTTTKTTGDQGVDLIVIKNSQVTAIQAKCYNNSVGNGAVQEVIAGAKFYNADKGIVITNNYFTSSAKDLANKTGIILWDRDKLSDMIRLIY